MADGITRTNRLILSPDDKVLYVNDSRGEYMLAFDVQSRRDAFESSQFHQATMTQPETQGPYKMRSAPMG